MSDEVISARLYDLLEKRRMPYVELDRRCGFPIGLTSKYVGCKSGISVRNLRKIKRALGCTWDELLGR